MSKNKKQHRVNFQNSYYSSDPHFRRLYDKINELVKEGKSQEEILKNILCD